MENLIRCYTMFDITFTGIATRSKPKENEDYKIWAMGRNQQANFDTLLQVISLRSQPDLINKPKITEEHLDYFGTSYSLEDYKIWYFDFSIHHTDVYDIGNEKFKKLYDDLQSIPMILIGTEHKQLGNLIDTTREHKNIYFVELGNE